MSATWRKNIDPDLPTCEHTAENCLHFGRLGQYIVENGLGRDITREETQEILRQAAETEDNQVKQLLDDILGCNVAVN